MASTNTTTTRYPSPRAERGHSRVVEAIRAGYVTAPAIAEVTGMSRESVSVQLVHLTKRQVIWPARSIANPSKWGKRKLLAWRLRRSR